MTLVVIAIQWPETVRGHVWLREDTSESISHLSRERSVRKWPSVRASVTLCGQLGIYARSSANNFINIFAFVINRAFTSPPMVWRCARLCVIKIASDVIFFIEPTKMYSAGRTSFRPSISFDGFLSLQASNDRAFIVPPPKANYCPLFGVHRRSLIDSLPNVLAKIIM